MKLVIDLIRGKNALEASSMLRYVNKGTTTDVKKTLDSAISNAKQNGVEADQLFISKIQVDKGPMWKRHRAGSFGRANPILKRTTHLTIELDVALKQVKKIK